MEFVHKPYQPDETIAAIATPLGGGGISIVRISGKNALNIAAKLFSGPVHTYKTHTAHLGYVLDESGKKIDEALLLVFLGNKSFTGEETVEIQGHGGLIAARLILEAAVRAGARSAMPGEFTLRAFMNGKLDLAQAEAVSHLISAKNEKAFSLASSFLEGKLSKKIEEFQKKITTLTAIIEAWVDFPEEGLEFSTAEEMILLLEEAASKIATLIATFQDGKRIHQGINLCIIGAPNVGKSSLMNALLQKERAIVTPIPGTTRDLLEEDVTLNGLHFRLIDTAGIRETEDIVEKEGIRRSKMALKQGDLILWVLDATHGLSSEEKIFMKELPEEKTIAIWNKSDLEVNQESPLCHTVRISAKTGFGLDELKRKIDEIIWQNGAPEKEELLITTVRHKTALEQTEKHLLHVAKGLKEGISPEFLACDLRAALLELGTILGTNITEDILNSIFSQFCIGK